ncbi:C40 family peptidase [Kordiimonas sp. SCSIO 12603]|uniref:C40 family peptidase n=1 Tax=Kordiimonas sp. SCSIO 12603 TaxID=2829596 RepID=UPI002102B2EE|nr:NlpC/P60 family protein [Kordiimonas sp. SCSIO 12603]UTW58709.1 C40 family peptidase [Kordiimonas sp. SCSIO 12603]
MNNVTQAFGFPDFLDPKGLLETAAHLSLKDEASHQVSEPIVLLKEAADIHAETLSCLLYGEPVYLEKAETDWAFITSLIDGYRGWVEISSLSQTLQKPTHQISAPLTHIYAKPSLKSRPMQAVPMGSYLTATTGAEENKFLPLADGNWVYSKHLDEIGAVTADPVGIALSFLGSPYLWGGRSRLGIDCSGLIQISLAACGIRTHRDSSAQFNSLGRLLEQHETPRHGDLAFFPGHVGWMLDDTRLLHANATHMAVTIDPLEDVIRWVASETGKPPFSGFKRLTT